MASSSHKVGLYIKIADKPVSRRVPLLVMSDELNKSHFQIYKPDDHVFHHVDYKKNAEQHNDFGAENQDYVKQHKLDLRNNPNMSPELKSAHVSAIKAHKEAANANYKAAKLYKKNSTFGKVPSPQKQEQVQTAGGRAWRLFHMAGAQSDKLGVTRSAQDTNKAIEGQQPAAAKVSESDPMYRQFRGRGAPASNIHIEAAKHYIQSDFHGRHPGGWESSQYHNKQFQQLRKQGAQPSAEHFKIAMNELHPRYSQAMKSVGLFISL